MSVQAGTSCPEAVLASIAWYPDQLDEDRRGQVESHAAECSACREELAFVQGESDPEIDLPDADRVYAGVLARIERSETGAPRASQAPPRRTRRTQGSRPAALAASIALALLVGGVGGVWLSGEPQPGYSPASAPPERVTPEDGVALDVVFRPDVRAESIQSALRAVGGEIVSGPSQGGLYRIRLAPSADAASAAEVLGGAGQGVATFAQPAVR